MNYELFRVARDFGKYGILDSKKKVWFFRIFLIVVLVICLLHFFKVPGFALTTSTYQDLLGNGTVCNNLLSFVPYNKSYVIFQNSSDSYYCFYGSPSDFNISNNVITANNLDFVSYVRSGQQYSYTYHKGTDNLSLSVSHVITSNLDSDFLMSENYNYSSVSTQWISFIAMLIFFPIIMITNLRRLGREYY